MPLFIRDIREREKSFPCDPRYAIPLREAKNTYALEAIVILLIRVNAMNHANDKPRNR